MDTNKDLECQIEEVGTSKTYEKEVKRGPTIIQKVIKARSNGIKFEVGWNESGQPIDPNSSMFVSYIGAVVRQNVPITIDNWRDKALKDAKDIIWNDIQTTFVLDEGRKSYVLRVAGKIHRGFRSHLSNFYLKDREGNTNAEPPKIYQHYISKDEWSAFVGKGILHNTSGEVLHNIPIPAGHVKVSPTVAFEPTAPLPIPDNDGDMKFLSDAIGSYVAWPTHLVALQKKIPKDKSVTSPEKVQINKPPLQPKKGSKPQKLEVNRAAKLQRLEGNKAAKLAATKNLDRGKSVAAAAAPNKSQPRLGKYRACLDIQIKRNMGSNDDSRIVHMNKDIFGDEYVEYLEKEHIYELLEHKELSATVMSLYIR
ncbi:uncharacterized protein [Cicer arietinum]|uniref:uncharacterized protein n=1 Tax=Cicer arietinum TaxID=3827 RepID=UPI003CC5DE43